MGDSCCSRQRIPQHQSTDRRSAGSNTYCNKCRAGSRHAAAALCSPLAHMSLPSLDRSAVVLCEPKRISPAREEVSGALCAGFVGGGPLVTSPTIRSWRERSEAFYSSLRAERPALSRSLSWGLPGRPARLSVLICQPQRSAQMGWSQRRALPRSRRRRRSAAGTACKLDAIAVPC